MAIEAEDDCDSDRLTICENAAECCDKIAKDNSILVVSKVLLTDLRNFSTTYHVTDMNRIRNDSYVIKTAEYSSCLLLRL